MNHRQLKRRNRLLILFVCIGLICFIIVEWVIDELQSSDADWVPVNSRLQEWLDWGKEFAPPEPQIIHLNEATEAEFTSLTGIGPAKAKEIITYRNEHGPFQSIEQIMEVSGIGPATFENIKEWITIGEEAEPLGESQGENETNASNERSDQRDENFAESEPSDTSEEVGEEAEEAAANLAEK